MRNKKSRIISNKLALSALLLLLVACSSTGDQNSYVDLGDGFKYILEYPQVIIYSTSKDSPASGENVIGPIVTRYAVHKNLIFAISRDEPAIPSTNEELFGQARYWIIDKDEEIGDLSSIDSTQFFAEINRLKVTLLSK